LEFPLGIEADPLVIKVIAEALEGVGDVARFSVILDGGVAHTVYPRDEKISALKARRTTS